MNRDYHQTESRSEVIEKILINKWKKNPFHKPKSHKSESQLSKPDESSTNVSG